MKTARDILNGSVDSAQRQYCVKTGEKIIYNLTLAQLETLYQEILRFQETENMALPEPSQTEDDEIEIQKYIMLSENECQPESSYSLYSKDCEIQMASQAHMKKISEALKWFLLSDTQNFIGQQDDITSIEPAIYIGKDHSPETRHPVFNSEININKRITYNNRQKNIQTRYMISANELCSCWMTYQQFILFRQELCEFLSQEKACPSK